jgi:hypothetical protein
LTVEFGENRSLGTTTRAFRITYASRAIYFAAGLTLKSRVLNLLDIFKAITKEKNIKLIKFIKDQPFDYFVTPDNILSLLREKDGGEIDLLTIDIDSYDYFVAKKIFQIGYRPRVCIFEYNPSLPVDSFLSIGYPPSKNSFINRRIYGASFGAMNSLATGFGYKLVHVSGFCNLFYVRSDFAFLFSEPNYFDEIPKGRAAVMQFIEKFCQKGFVPSWLDEPELNGEDLSYFDDVSK